MLHHLPARPRPESCSHSRLISPSFPLSLPPPSPPARIAPPQLVGRHGSGEQCPPAILSPAIPPLPFFFIKLPKQHSVEGRTVAGVQPAGPAVTGRRPARRTLAPSSNRMPRLLSGSNGTLSVAIGAIGKQSMKMNYPVSSPSLMNK